MDLEFKTVTLIGSGKFENEFHDLEKHLTRLGYRVLTSFLFKDDFSEEDSPGLIPTLNELVKENIRISDLVYIVDPDHYIGESTFNEIRYALSLHKPVRYYSLDFDPMKRLEDSELELIKNFSNDTAYNKYICGTALCKYCPNSNCNYRMNS